MYWLSIVILIYVGKLLTNAATKTLRKITVSWRFLHLSHTAQCSRSRRLSTARIINAVHKDIMTIRQTEIYRVIQNDCRGFNNLSYTIHLRQEYMYFLFNRTTLQVFVTYLTGALYVHPLWFYKHQHDNRVRSTQSAFSLPFAAILVNSASSGEMHNYCTQHIIKENCENFLIHRCN